MKSIKQISIGFLLMLVLLLSSCDPIVHAGGIILDQETKRPITDVAITFYRNGSYDAEHTSHSDSYGKFNFMKIASAKQFQLDFSKAGYISQLRNFTNESNNDTVFLAKHLDYPF